MGRTGKHDRARLMTYLGAQQSTRFPFTRGRVSTRATEARRRLVVVVLVLLAVALWGLWREFAG
ncbi:MAG: hypothetical protein JXR77_13660 [Lentisphaeria bacterium]|nr:hypothetical protein [Lentisphaeria bacterium]